MHVSRWLAIAMLSSGCGAPGASRDTPTTTELALHASEQKTSTDPSVNPHAAAMAEFKTRVDAYADLHKRLATGDARHRETDDAAKIGAATAALAAKVQGARAEAKQGDIFTPAVRPGGTPGEAVTCTAGTIEDEMIS